MSAAFIARTLALRTAAHQLHLTSTSYAQHVALDEFYTGLVPLVDSFAEVYMGLATRITAFPPVMPPAGEPTAGGMTGGKAVIRVARPM